MKISRLAARIAMAAVLAALSAALDGGAQAQTPVQTQAQTADPVIATVNGANIYRSDIEAARAQLPEQYRNMPVERLYQPLLSQLIRSKLISQKARADKLQDDAGHKKRLAMIEDRLLEEAYLQKIIEGKLTEEAMRARYKDTVAKMPANEEVRARHILVKTEAEAVAIIKDIAGGADFAKLAGEKSIGPTKTQGGDLGYFGRGQMVKPFEEAAFGLKPGEVTQKPVQSPFGWHVIKLEDKRAQKPPSFEEAQDQIGQEMSQEIAEETVNKLTEGAAIQRFELDGSAPRLKRMEPAPAAPAK